MFVAWTDIAGIKIPGIKMAQAFQAPGVLPWGPGTPNRKRKPFGMVVLE